MFPPPLGKGCGGFSHTPIKPAALRGAGATAAGMEQVHGMEGKAGMAAQALRRPAPLPCPNTGLSPAFGGGGGVELTLRW